MADNGKRALDGEQRAEMRAAYEAGASINELSKRYGVRRHTIAGWRDKEAWAVQPTVQVDAPTVQRRAQAQVIDIATRKAVEAASSQIETLGVVIAEDLARHGKIANLLMEAAEQMLEDFQKQDGDLAESKEIDGRMITMKEGRASVFQKVVTGVKSAVMVSREINGRTAGDPSIAASVESKVDQIEFYVPSLEEIAESASA